MNTDINQIEPPELIKKIPHLIKYMGSKREILDFVSKSIKHLNVESEWLCDLFSGTGVVGGTLKDDYKIHANDVQAYSSILSHTYLLNLRGQLSADCLEEIGEVVEEIGEVERVGEVEEQTDEVEEQTVEVA